MKKHEIAGLRPDMLDGEQTAPAIQKTIGVLIFPGFEMRSTFTAPWICGPT